MKEQFEQKLRKIREENKTQEYESMWETDCPYCKKHHTDIVDGIPLNVDNSCPKTDEMIMGWRLKGIGKKFTWRIIRADTGEDVTDIASISST